MPCQRRTFWRYSNGTSFLIGLSGVLSELQVTKRPDMGMPADKLCLIYGDENS